MATLRETLMTRDVLLGLDIIRASDHREESRDEEDGLTYDDTDTSCNIHDDWTIDHENCRDVPATGRYLYCICILAG